MGFTKLGHPIQGQKYTITQGDTVVPITVVGKMFGQLGNMDLVGIVVQDHNGERMALPWPMEAEEGAPDVTFESGWEDTE